MSRPAVVSKDRSVWTSLWWAILAGAALSVIAQGERFGAVNQASYVPYAVKLLHSPQFQDSAFHQSLSPFASLFWQSVSLVATEANASWLFFGLHWLVRAVGLYASMLVLGSLGVPHRALAFCTWVLAIAPIFWDNSPISGHHVFTPYLSQTELANALFVGAVVLGVRRKPLWAWMVAGLSFNINVPVGAWALAVLGILALIDVIRESSAERWLLALALVTSMLAAILLTLPTLLWIVTDAKGLPHVDFDYAAYLEGQVAPLAFVTHANALTVLQFIFFSAVIALLLLRQNQRRWLNVHAAMILVFLIGVMPPFTTLGAVLPNLHLLRIDGLIGQIGMLAILATAVRSFAARPKLSDARAQDVMTLAALSGGHWLLAGVAGMALLAGAGTRLQKRIYWVGLPFGLVVLLAAAFTGGAIADVSRITVLFSALAIGLATMWLLVSQSGLAPKVVMAAPMSLVALLVLGLPFFAFSVWKFYVRDVSSPEHVSSEQGLAWLQENPNPRVYLPAPAGKRGAVLFPDTRDHVYIG